MAQVDVFGLTSINMPSFGLGTGYVPILLAVFVFCAVGGIAIYLWFDFKVYNKKIILFENIAGQGYQPTFKDRARLVKLGDAGEELLFLKKRKVYRSAYGRKMGKNTYWFAIGQDGYWYNVVLGDIDAKMGMLDIEPIDRDMRYMHVAIRKNIQDRYKKEGFMGKYATIVFSFIFLIIMLIGIWFLLDKMGDISGGIAGAVDASRALQVSSEKLISSMDNICSGGSGIQKL